MVESPCFALCFALKDDVREGFMLQRKCVLLCKNWFLHKLNLFALKSGKKEGHTRPGIKKIIHAIVIINVQKMPGFVGLCIVKEN